MRLGIPHGHRYRAGLYVGVTAHLAVRICQHRTGSVHGAEYNLTRLVRAEHADDITACTAHDKHRSVGGGSESSR